MNRHREEVVFSGLFPIIVVAGELLDTIAVSTTAGK
jgi:hypothetical protein